MRLTRQHFELIARELRTEVEALREEQDEYIKQGRADYAERHRLRENGVFLAASRMAYAFKDINPNFDRDRFLAACGFEN